MFRMFANPKIQYTIFWFIAIGIAAIAIVTSPAVNQKKTEASTNVQDVR